MNKFKGAVLSIISAVCILSCCSCTMSPYEKVNDITKYTSVKENGLFSVDTSEVAENSKFKLYWDDLEKNVLFQDKQSGKIWSTTPLNAENQPSEDNSFGFSPVNLTYIIRSAFSTQDITGKAGAVSSGNITCKKIKNGIEVTLLFDEVSISVPVCFELTDKGLKVYVELKNIGENADATGFRTYSLQLAPYLCSVNNSKDNYIFVPSGSGAIMYADVRGDGSARQFKSSVYGEDASNSGQESYTEVQPVRMSVFSASGGENTLCGVIEDGAEFSSILANAGDSSSGFSNAFAEFRVRGLSVSTQEYGGNSGKSTYNYYSYDRISDGRISVLYIPVSGEKEGYMKTAEIYRDYLNSENKRTAKTEDSVLNLKFIGGIQIKERIFGIPYNSVYPLTTLEDTEKIIKKIKSDTGITPEAVQLLGFGESGIQSGKLGGGFKISKKLGNSFSSLNKLCSKENISLFLDYDILYFNKSGAGFSKKSDNSVTANNFPVEVYRFSPATSDIMQEYSASSILKRALAEKAGEKVVKSAEKYKLSGVSLSSYSNTVYSDFSDKKYTNSGHFKEDYKNVIKLLNKNSLSTASNNANDFAALLSDIVFDTPAKSAEFSVLDTDIPFYQIVLKGTVPFSLESINIADDTQGQILKSVETGAGLQFTFISDYDAENSGYLNPDLQKMKFSNHSAILKETIDKTEKYLTSVKGASISDYKIINENVRKTVFDNGVTVYVNFGSESINIDSVEVEPNSFKAVK